MARVYHGCSILYGYSDEGEDGDGKKGNENPGGRDSGDYLASSMVGRFVEVCRRELKVNESKVMVLNEEEGLEFEVYIDRICLKHISEFWVNQVQMGKSSRKVAIWVGLKVPLSP